MPWSTAAHWSKPERKRKQRKWLIWRVWWSWDCLLPLAPSSHNALWTSLRLTFHLFLFSVFILCCVHNLSLRTLKSYCFNRWPWRRCSTLQPPTSLRHECLGEWWQTCAELQPRWVLSLLNRLFVVSVVYLFVFCLTLFLFTVSSCRVPQNVCATLL